MSFVFTGLPCCGRHVNTHSEQFEFAYPVKLGKSTGPLPSRIEARSASFEPNRDEGVGASAIARKALSDSLDVRAFNAAVGNRTNQAPRPRRRIKRAYWQSSGQQQRSQFNVYRNVGAAMRHQAPAVMSRGQPQFARGQPGHEGNKLVKSGKAAPRLACEDAPLSGEASNALDRHDLAIIVPFQFIQGDRTKPAQQEYPDNDVAENPEIVGDPADCAPKAAAFCQTERRRVRAKRRSRRRLGADLAA